MLHRITIATVKGPRRRWGFGGGPLAVTRSTGAAPGWTVTHVPTGFEVAKGDLGFREACRFRRSLLALRIWNSPASVICQQRDAVTQAVTRAGLRWHRYGGRIVVEGQ